MKHLVWIPFALLLGFVLGGWAPRMEVRKLEGELKLARTREGPRAGAPTTLGALTQVIPLDRRTEAPPPATNAAPSTATNAVTNAAPSEAAGSSTNAPPRPSRENMRERIDQAMEAWRVRSDIARNTFVANAALDPEEQRQFDVLTAAMNLRLQTTIEQFANGLRSGEKMTPEAGARLVNDLSGALVLTYNEMDRKFTPRWRASAGDRFDLADMIDPKVAEPLVGLDDQLDGGWRRRRR
jgi:hypothetical protein